MNTASTARAGARRRMGAAVTAVLAVMAIAFAPAAFAATQATWNGDKTWGAFIKVNGGNTVGAQLYSLDVEGGGTLEAYCVDLGTPITVGDTYGIEELVSQVPNADRIRWILQNSYPVLSLAELEAASGIAPIDVHKAIAGTAAALWFFSNGTQLDDTNSATTKALFAYLTGSANVGAADEPAPTLSITPSSGAGEPGDRIGPFTVDWTGTGTVDVALSPSGPPATLYGQAAGGSPVTTAADGDQLWIEIAEGAAAGSVTLTASGTGTAGGGFVLINPETPDDIQKLAFAAVRTVEVTATATARWVVPTPTTTSPTPTPTTTSPTPTPTTTSPTPTDPGTTPPNPEPSTTSPNPTPSTTTPSPGTTVPTPESSSPSLAVTGAAGIGPMVVVGLTALALGALLLLGMTRTGRGTHV